MAEPLPVGTAVGDKYVVEALIGAGGIAEVYKVRHVELGSMHALKVLTWRKKGLAERFLKEGQFQASLGHPNVVTVTDIVRFDGLTALVMEYIPGITLERMIAETGALPVHDAFALFVPILAAVAAAHDRGVLHRDLKPANVLLAETPVGWVPKVVDFGIAKFVEEEMGTGSTAAGMVLGTPGYMAPEQVRDSSTVDARADIFALSAILYEMLTGRKAFGDDDGGIAITATLDREPRPIEIPELSAELGAAILRGMARDRDQRYPDCRTFAKALGLGAHPLLLDMATRRSLGRTFDAVLSTGSSPYGTLPTPPQVELPRPAVERGWSSTMLVVPFAAGVVVLVAMVGLLVASALVFVGLRSRVEAQDVVEAPLNAPVPSEPEPVVVAPVPASVPTGGSEVAAVPVPIVSAAPAPLPAPGGVPAPSPAPVAPAPSTAAPDPVTAPPDPVLEVAVAPVPAVVPAPAPVPVPVPVAVAPAVSPEEEAPPFDPMTVLGGGPWLGKATGRPFELQFTGSSRDLVRAEAKFITGTTSRREQLSGTFDRGSGRLALRSTDGSVRFDGALVGRTLSGTYAYEGRRELPWSVSR